MIKTSCEHCLFKKVENNIQIGCELDRLDKYEKSLVGNHYELNGLCNYCRNCYSKVAEAEDKIAAVKDECRVKYSVVYMYDNNYLLLEKTLKSCIGNSEPKDFIVCVNPDIDVDIQKLYEDLNKIYNRVIVSKSILNDDAISTYDYGIKRATGDYLYFCECGEEIDKNCINKLNSLLNDEVKDIYLIYSKNFSIVYKKLFIQYSHLDSPMAKLSSSLLNNKNYKESVILW